MIFLKETREALLLRIPTGGVCAEVGVQCGNYSRFILEHAKPRKLILIDVWKHQDETIYTDRANMSQDKHTFFRTRVLQRFAQQIAEGIVDVRCGFSCDELVKLSDNSLDFIYIDANHSYEAVLADLEASFRVVKPDGFIIGHDYESDGRKYGVIPAVTSFLNMHQEMKLLALTLPTGNGCDPSYVLCRRGMKLPPARI